MAQERTERRAPAEHGSCAVAYDYSGRKDAFAQAIADVAVAYAEQTEQDHEKLAKAGRIATETGIWPTCGRKKPIARDWKNSILSQGQGDLFDRWIEFLGALVLAVATVATAWSAYQAALWSGDEAKFYFEATAAQMDAHQNHARYMQRASVQANLFVEYAAALSADNQELADFLYQRFPVELETAMDAWLATDPWTNPEAPKTPFAIPEYRLPEEEAAQQQLQLAQERFAAAADADEDADQYVLLTVIFASALFFSGIAGKFQWRIIDGLVLGMGMIVLTVGLVMLTQLPVQ